MPDIEPLFGGADPRYGALCADIIKLIDQRPELMLSGILGVLEIVKMHLFEREAMFGK